MTGYEFGDVVLVPFPFTDQSTSKRRPAVIVSSDAYQRERRDLIILAVTSQARSTTGLGEVAVSRWESASSSARGCWRDPVDSFQRPRRN